MSISNESGRCAMPEPPERQIDEAPYRVVEESEQRTSTILELWLRPLAAPLQYLPGEYVLLEDCHRGIPPRSYSIANAPRSDGLISLLVTRIQGGWTRTWIHEQLRAGDEVSLTGPAGSASARTRKPKRHDPT